MQREPRAFLLDVIDSCEAIAQVIAELGLDDYKSKRVVRSAVEREFITIGEAMAALRRISPTVFKRVAQGQKIVDFRNQLTHGYKTVNDAVVWAVAVRDAPALRVECEALLIELDSAGAD